MSVDAVRRVFPDDMMPPPVTLLAALLLATTRLLLLGMAVLSSGTTVPDMSKPAPRLHAKATGLPEKVRLYSETDRSLCCREPTGQ